jgi:hypothetical protein
MKNSRQTMLFLRANDLTLEIYQGKYKVHLYTDIAGIFFYRAKFVVEQAHPFLCQRDGGNPLPPFGHAK